MNPVDFLPGARRDLDDSFDWYAKRSATAATCFVNAVDVALTRIASQPDQFAAIDPRHHECSVKRFPFRIIYRVEERQILVVAVAHAKRRPGFWLNRT